MKNPNPINLTTSAQVRKAGWQAETRDADGHLCRTHVPFETDEDIIWLVREALEHGETVTIWPNSELSEPPPPQPHVVASPADQIIGQIEELFPSWRSYRDLIDCIECTLHELRKDAGREA